MPIKSLCELDVHRLEKAGVRLVILDLDNTVFPYGKWIVPDCVLGKIRMLRKKFDVVGLSNTIPVRAQISSVMLGIPVVSLAFKPLPFSLWKVITGRGWCPECTVIIGDQIFTDGLLALLSGVRVVLVSPLSREDAPHTKLFRRLESSVVAKMIIDKLKSL